MAIAYRDGTTASDVTGDLAVTIPATVQAGDLMVLTWHASIDTAIHLPSGWSYLPESGTPGPHSVGTSRAAGIYKVATGSDASTVLDLGAVDETEMKESAVLGAWSGVDTSSPFDGPAVFASTTSPAGTSHASPEKVTTVADTVVVTTISFKDSSVAAITTPTGWTDRGRVTMTGGGRSSTGHASKTAATAGTYGGETWTTDATPSSSAAFTFALNPQLTTQTSRPAEDITVTNVTDQDDGTTDLYTAIDETTLSTADYVKAVEGGIYEAKLAALSAPPSGSGVEVTYVLGLGDGATAATWDVYLMDGETQIAHWADEIDADGVEVTHTLTSLEIDEISAWTDLRLRWVLTDVTG